MRQGLFSLFPFANEKGFNILLQLPVAPEAARPGLRVLVRNPRQISARLRKISLGTRPQGWTVVPGLQTPRVVPVTRDVASTHFGRFVVSRIHSQQTARPRQEVNVSRGEGEKSSATTLESRLKTCRGPRLRDSFLESPVSTRDTETGEGAANPLENRAPVRDVFLRRLK